MAKGCKGNCKNLKKLLTGWKNINILICQKNGKFVNPLHSSDKDSVLWALQKHLLAISEYF